MDNPMSTDITRIIDRVQRGTSISGLAESLGLGEVDTLADLASQLGWEHGVDDDGEPCLVLPGWVTEEDGFEAACLQAATREEALAPHRERKDRQDRYVLSWRRGIRESWGRAPGDGDGLEMTRSNDEYRLIEEVTR